MIKPQQISLLIVDDHPVVVAGIQSLLQDVKNVGITGCCSDARSARGFLATHETDIVLLDINLPDASGIDLCLEFKKAYPSLRIIALSNYNERSVISKMLENGASGYLLKNATSAEMRNAINDAMDNKFFFSQDVAQKMMDTTALISPPQLTRRETEILKLVAEGFTSNAIAETLFISLLTVETHRRNIMQKFNATNMAAIIKIAVKSNMI